MRNQYLKIAVIFVLFLAVLTSGVQTSRIVSAQSPQPTEYSTRLADFMQSQMERYKIPGAALTIVRHGEIEYSNGFGIANNRSEPVTPDTPFLLASVSKSITAMGVMQLVEAGKMQLDDPVVKYIPWFQVAGGGGDEMTIADLLYQTSGFTELGGNQVNLFKDGPDALEGGVRILANQALAFSPGEGWEYSNLNYNLLGLIIQEVSGQPYETYIQEQIFAPLEMNNSFTSMSEARDAGAASGYYPFFGIPLPFDFAMPYTRAALPSSGLWSSAADMSRYLLAHLEAGPSGDRPLLSEAGFATLHQPGYVFDEVQGYAMGWTRNSGFMHPDFLEQLETELKDYDSLTVLFHEGDWTGYKSVAFLIPEAEYGMILLLNTNDPAVASAYRFFAWDIALIATGGEAQYFPPGEEFYVRYSRLIFGLITLLLAGGLVYSLRTWRISRQPAAALNLNSRKILVTAFVILPILAALLGTIYWVLLPDSKTDLASLLRFAPDLGLLALLITLLSVALGTIWSGLVITSLARGSRKNFAVPEGAMHPLE